MIWLAVVLGIAGFLLSAFFSGSETGFYRATRLRLVLDALGGDTVARCLLFLANHPALFVATSLVGSTAANYLVSLATVISVTSMFPAHRVAAELIAPLVIAPLLLVYGELLPKNLFLQAPNRLLRAVGPFFLFFVIVLFPIAGILWGIGRLLSRLVRDSSEPVRLVLAQREIRRILTEGHEAGLLHHAQQTLAHGIFAMARKPVRQFVVPLAQIPKVRADMSKRDVLRIASRSQTAVIPVVASDSPGRLLGCVRVIDLRLDDSDEIRPLRRLLEIRDNISHLAALMRLESEGEHIAQVVDARRETIGIVTLERLREALF